MTLALLVLRLRLPLCLIAGVIAGVALLAAACAGPVSPDSFKGTVLNGANAAPDFRLTDQFGRTASLADFRGKVVLLTFLYTGCPDVCPVAANHLREAREALSEAGGGDTAIVVVSVDPEGDSVEAALAYSERWGMAEGWAYLTGEEDALRAVWDAYYIDPYLHGPGRDGAAGGGHSQASGGGASGLAARSGRIIHSAPIYLIDAEGVMRVAFTLPFETADLVNDVRLLGGLGGLGLRRLQLGFGLVGDLGEGLRVADGEVGKHLAVDVNAGELEAVDEAAVCGAVGAGGGVYADVPEAAHIAFLLFAVRV